METQVIVRIDSRLKNKAQNLAKAEGKNVSLVVRDLLENYVRSRDMSSYIDNLWKRIGTDLKKKRRSQKDVEKAIKASRKKG